MTAGAVRRGLAGPPSVVALAGVGLAAWTFLTAVAGARQEPEVFTERVDVHVANVEVVVRDRDGRPVHGLEAADFEIREDGQPVELTNFFEVRGGAEVYPGGAPPPTGVVPTSVAPVTQGLFLVVYVDLLHLDVLARNRLLETMEDYFRESLGPDDRVMLVTFDGKVNIAERFTDDLDVLAARFDELAKVVPRGGDLEIERRRVLADLSRAPLAPRPDDPRSDESAFLESGNEALRILGSIGQQITREIQRVDLSIEGLAQFSASLAGLPGRKAMLYVSQGLPARPGEALVHAWIEKYSFWASANSVREVLSEIALAESLPQDLGDRFGALVRAANAYQVSFYALAPPARGGSHSGLGAQNRGIRTVSGVSGESPVTGTLDLFGRESSLLEIAGGTGGLAFTRSYNASGLLDRVASDFSDFYSLGYRPPHPADDAYHQVEVTVRGRPDLEVRHTGGYREIDSLEELRQVAVSALRYEIDTNPLGMAIQVGRHLATVGGQYRVPIVLAIPFSNLAILPRGSHYIGRVIAYVVVESEDGDRSPFQRIELPIRIPAEEYEEAARGVVGYQVDLTMRRGLHRVAVAVRDEIADVRSSLSFHLDVGKGLR